MKSEAKRMREGEKCERKAKRKKNYGSQNEMSSDEIDVLPLSAGVCGSGVALVLIEDGQMHELITLQLVVLDWL